LKGFWNVHMNSIIRRVKKLFEIEGGLTQRELQAPNEAPEDTRKYEKEFERYIANLRSETFRRLFVNLMFLFFHYETADGENQSSIRDRRSHINILPGTDLNYDTKYREIYEEIYEKITPPLLKILVNWFRSIAFPPNQEQIGQADNPDSIIDLEKIIYIINLSNPDKRRELVLKLVEAVGFSSDQSIKDYIDTHLNKEPQEEPQESNLLPISPELLKRQELTSHYIIFF